MRKKINELDVLAAAYLYGQQQTQEAIGRNLGLSQTVVSRLLSDAKKQGYTRKVNTFVRKDLDDAAMARIQTRVRPVHHLQEILARLSANGSKLPGPVVHVYPSQSRNMSLAAWRHRIDDFANACVKDLLEVLSTATVIGVSWGDTLASVIAVMKGAATAPGAARRQALTAVPLIGEPLGLNITQHSSSVLAARLEEALNPEVEPGQGHALSLAPVPALIPADMTEPELDAIWKLIGRITAYKEIFGTDGLIGRIDAVLTSTSTLERPLGFEDDRLLRTAGVPREKLNKLVLGDMCGALITRPKLNEAEKAQVESIRKRWTGVTIRQLRGCASRAAGSSAPGVMVLAIGANKAPVVHAAVRGGLIQHLFCDTDLANRLEEMCSGSMPEY